MVSCSLVGLNEASTCMRENGGLCCVGRVKKRMLIWRQRQGTTIREVYLSRLKKETAIGRLPTQTK